MSKYERMARLLKIISLVRANPRLTRSDLARLCEVDCVRTIQRDINSLAIAEVPIFWSGEGYEIMPCFFMPPLALTEEEALSLVLSTRAYSDGEGEFHENTIEFALSKVITTLTKKMRQSLEENLDKIIVESRKVPDIKGLVSRLYHDIINTKQLQINYYSDHTKILSEHVIEPYGLVFRDHFWYLVAFCHAKNDILVFRTNSIKTLDYTGKTFVYPSRFSLAEHMAKSWHVEMGEETEVIVKFSARIAPLIKEVNWHSTQRIENLPDGSILYTVTVAGTKEISSWILSYGDQAEVLSPQSLRKKVAAVVEKMHRRDHQLRIHESSPLGLAIQA